MEWFESAREFLKDHWVEILLRLGAATLVILLATVVGGLLANWAQAALRKKSGRGATLAPAIRSAVKVFSLGLGFVMALDQIGIDVKTVLAGAGILGLAVGFGAQTLVKDVISGFFLILDEAVAEGDIVTISGEVSGVVEAVGLRMTRLRSFNGQLWYVPNGEIRHVGNFSRTWTRAVVEVGVAYEADLKKGMQVLLEVGQTWAHQNAELVLEPPEVQGLMGLNASDVGIRLVIKLKAPNHFAAERELRRLTKEAFDAAGVEIPFPRRVVYHRQEAESAARAWTGGDSKGAVSSQ